MATPKRGDTKKINGNTYRWAWSSKQKKFTWVRDYSKDKLSAKEGLRVKDFKGTGDNIGDSTSKNLNKVGIHNRREPSNWNQRQLEKKKERDSRPVGRNWQNPYGAKGDGKPSSGDVSKSSGKKMHSIEKKNREIHGDERITLLKEQHAKWKADRKKAREERRKKRLKSKK